MFPLTSYAPSFSASLLYHMTLHKFFILAFLDYNIIDFLNFYFSFCVLLYIFINLCSDVIVSLCFLFVYVEPYLHAGRLREFLAFFPFHFLKYVAPRVACDTHFLLFTLKSFSFLFHFICVVFLPVACIHNQMAS